MRFSIKIRALVAATAIFGSAACGPSDPSSSAPSSSAPTSEAASAPAPTPVDVAVSDVLPNLQGEPTGVNFWIHPNVAFSSLMILAGADGLVSYNIEDGNEVSRVPDIDFDGAAVSYFGFGPLAAGLVAALESETGDFAFYGIENTSRLFVPLEGGPEIRGNVRDFCMGRAHDNDAPTLFVVQKEVLQIFNLTLAQGGRGVSIESQTRIETPDNMIACAVHHDGSVVLAAQSGAVYRLAGENSFASPFATLAGAPIVDLGVLTGLNEEGGHESRFAALSGDTGAIAFIDGRDGHMLGTVRFGETFDYAAVQSASVMGLSGANLGAIYRNGAAALGASESADSDAFAVSLAPVSGVSSALTLPSLAPFNPRGVAPASIADDGLIIEPTLPKQN